MVLPSSTEQWFQQNPARVGSRDSSKPGTREPLGENSRSCYKVNWRNESRLSFIKLQVVLAALPPLWPSLQAELLCTANSGLRSGAEKPSHKRRWKEVRARGYGCLKGSSVLQTQQDWCTHELTETVSTQTRFLSGREGLVDTSHLEQSVELILLIGSNLWACGYFLQYIILSFL